MEPLLIGIVRILAYAMGLVVAVWFYRSAEKRAKDPIRWAAIGAAVFYTFKLPWTFFVVKANPQHGATAGLLLSLSSTLVGLIPVVALWFTRLRGDGKPPADGTPV